MNASHIVRSTAPVLAALAVAGCCCCVPAKPGSETSDVIGSVMKCDYLQVGKPGSERKFAWIPDQALSDQCVMLRGDPMHLVRAPLVATDFGTVCAVRFEVVAHPNQDSKCTPTDTLKDTDRFHVREWNGSFVLTIQRGTETLYDIPLEAQNVDGIKGYPWLASGLVDDRLFFYVFLEQKIKNGGIDKYYRVEVFDKEDPKWETTCKYEVPSDVTAQQVDCANPPPGDGDGQQSDTGGGGEPPLKQR